MPEKDIAIDGAIPSQITTSKGDSDDWHGRSSDARTARLRGKARDERKT